MPYVDCTDGTRLFYRDWGSGRPVVFISSWALSSVMWQYPMEALRQRGSRCVAYDRRGHGRSDDPRGGYDYDTLAGDLAALLDRLDLRDVTLVAHSMGGGEAVRYLTRRGDGRIARLVLLACMLPFPTQTPDNLDGIPAEAFAALRASYAQDFIQWLKDNESPFVGRGLPGCDFSRDQADATIRDALQASLHAVIECNRAIENTDFRHEMKAIRVPVLVIHGDSDRGIPAEISGMKSARLIPRSRLVLYENGPHGLYMSHRARLVEDLSAFIQGRGEGSASEGPGSV